MRLSELRAQHHNTSHNAQGGGPQESAGTGSGFPLGTIRSQAAYPQPFDGLYNGRPVRIVATGDIVGMSPALQIVDENRQIDWVSAGDVKTTQYDFLPVTLRNDIRQRENVQQGGPQPSSLHYGRTER